MPLKSYSMQAASETARIGTAHVVAYLQTQSTTVSVENVEDCDEYRTKDIDLIWNRQSNGVFRKLFLEVKVDTYYRTGNYFFETFSNVEKNTPGCFMYSEADYFFYYFLGVEIHAIELAPVREWFKKNMARFPVKRTTTPAGSGFYHTEGRLVGRADASIELPGHITVIPYSKSWITNVVNPSFN